jgi:ATP-binding cassette subfamily B protein
VIDADLIVVMDKGRIIDTGNHYSLLSSSVLYKKLCDLQFDKLSDNNLKA